MVVPSPTPAPAPTPRPTPSPTPTPTTGPAAACPTGTGMTLTDVGTIGNYRSCRISPLITGAATLPKVAGVAYEITGRVDVGVDRGGAGTVGTAGNLTIEPGVVIYANTTNAENDFLVVNRGSTINATGTASAPIIFTSQQNMAGTVTEESQGQWGGVIIAGRAPISACNTAVAGGSVGCENVVEGTGNALYGGATAGDNSGVFQYVQIRFSGTTISPNNELQGLTLGGVGSGTTIDHVQVHNSSDDGVEIFGGTSNLRYLVFTGTDDDAVDLDVGYRGLIQFVIAIQKADLGTNDDAYAMEVDSNGSEDALPRTYGRIANFTFVNGTSATPAAIRSRGGADMALLNGIISYQNDACVRLNATETSATDKSTIRAANAGLQDLGAPTFNSIYFACTTLSNDSSGTTQPTDAETIAVINAGSNNVTNGTAAGAVTGGFLPGTGAAGQTAGNATTLNPSGSAFLVPAQYVGAANRANFGSGTNCGAVPAS